jgi:hypothetical protein
MSDAAPRANDEANDEDDAARLLAEQWHLEYVPASAVSIDPRALPLLPAAECRRLRAVPIATSDTGVVVGLAAPGEDRFDAVRGITGPQTRFVLVSRRVLDGLLCGRMFEDRAPSGPAPAPAAPPEPEPAPQPAEFAGPAPASPPVPAAVDGGLVDAIVAALEHRLVDPTVALERRVADPLERRVVEAPLAPSEPAAPKIGLAALVAQVDASIAAWSDLRAALATPDDELEGLRRSLRETKEQLSVAHAENDQHQRRVRALETELAESRALIADARLRLQDATEALEGGGDRIATSRELL